MKNEKLEKQASSEIAESRARFEKFALAYFDIISESFLRPNGEYTYPGLRDGWELWQVAERDTRERCAHEAMSFMWGHLGSIAVTENLAVELAERIRGKE